MAIKSYTEFVNENLVGQYSYYGAGSLFPIVSKLATEGKTAQQIYQYLTQLGIDEERKRSVISKIFLNESMDFDRINEVNNYKAEEDKIRKWLKSKGAKKSNETDYEFLWNDVGIEFDVRIENGIVVLYDGEQETVLRTDDFMSSYMKESKGGLYEDDLGDIAKADTKDLAKGIDPSKAKPDSDVEAALDKLKAGDEEDMDDKEKEGDTKTEDDDESTKVAALKSALQDAEKLDKIKKILSETFEVDFTQETDAEFLGEIFGYHSVLEKLSTQERSKLKDDDFIFSDTRSWPIHDEKHAKTALVWATWPQYADKKSAIIKAVIKKYPHLKGVGAAK